jgi:hypothetical protein
MPSSKPGPSSSAQFITGLAWTILIVAGWACLRLGLWLGMALADSEIGGLDPSVPGIGVGPEHILLGIGPPVSYFLAGAHIALAGFTVFAATALLKRRAWALRYFVGLLLLIAVEAVGFGLYFILQTEEGEVMGLRIASGVPIILLGLIAGLVARKLWRDKGISAEFG